MTEKRLSISVSDDSRHDLLPSNSDSQHQRPGRRKAITKENGMMILIMLSALLTKAAAVTGTKADCTAGTDGTSAVSSAVSMATAPMDPCFAASSGIGAAPRSVMATAGPLSTVSARRAAAKDVCAHQVRYLFAHNFHYNPPLPLPERAIRIVVIWWGMGKLGGAVL